MKYRCLAIVVILFLSSTSAALMRIQPGVYDLEGKLIRSKDQLFFAINFLSNSETKFLLSGSGLKALQASSNAKLRIKISKETLSSRGKAKLIKLLKYLHPFQDVKIYSQQSELSRVGSDEKPKK